MRALSLISERAPERAWWIGALALLALTPPTALAYTLDPHVLDGARVWAKPLKFELSFAVHFATVALVASRLSPPWRRGAMMRWLVPASLLGLAAEMIYMITQAALHEASHFNVSTPFHAFMFYGVMGGGALAIIAASLGVGWAAWRDDASQLGPGARLGAAVGLIAGSLLTLVFAFYMSQRLSRDVGPVIEAARKLPIVGWSMRSGDLRMPHFFANHTMQVLPLAGVLFDRALDARWSRRLTWLAAALWCAMCLVLFAATLQGRPLFAG